MSYNARMMFAEAEKDGVPKGLSEKVWNVKKYYCSINVLLYFYTYFLFVEL